MIRRILLPLDKSAHCDSAIEFAIKIAKIYNADIIGLVVLDLPGIEKSLGPVPLGASYYAKQLEQSKIEQAEKHIETRLKKFKEKCEKHSVSCRVHERQGIPSDNILDEAKFFDLLVIGTRTFYTFESKGKGTSLEKILKDSITPIVAVPEKLSMPNFPEEKINCLICFDGSIPASHALQRFGQLTISKFADVKILMSHDDKEYAEHSLYEAKAYLKSHLYKNVEKHYTSKNIIQTVKDDYLDWADLIVIGAHSDLGIFDFMVGSLARYLIRESDKSIFIGF